MALLHDKNRRHTITRFSFKVLAAMIIFLVLVGHSLIARAQLSASYIEMAVNVPTAVFTPKEQDPLELDAWCFVGNGEKCSDVELEDALNYKQVIVLPAGYTADHKKRFYSDLAKVVEGMTYGSQNIFGYEYQENILYYGIWLPGGTLGSNDVNFDAKISEHFSRANALTISPELVIEAIEDLQADTDDRIDPWAVLVIYNTNQTGVTATASTPVTTKSTSHAGFGIARVTRAHLFNSYNNSSAYTVMHELGHAGLGFVDEYVEQGFEDMNIQSVDAISNLAFFDASWGDFVHAAQTIVDMYDYRISEVLADNATLNISTTKYPSRVTTNYYRKINYECEGGMFFGRGTWHDSGNNFMNTGRVNRTSSTSGCLADRFGFDHSPAQMQVIEQTFNSPGTAARPNDRIRTAGPNTNWLPVLGGSVKGLIFDADKNNHLHPTTSYDVQIGWFATKTCYKKILGVNVPYPCGKVWKSVSKTVYPRERYIDLDTSALVGFSSVLHGMICTLGLDAFVPESSGISICNLSADELLDDLVPVMKFDVPYQEFTIQTPEGTTLGNIATGEFATTYYWQFRTNNGTYTSGYTEWDSFKRYF
ncbi:MAG: hypothetical protein HQM16_02720 [Deltaproteobacteria bacterium]|nr:hypothetical protein [Deltaproteobacteria bacterium]